ncbi:Uncharacterised protein [Segatella copri]|nr:Uncharacterised protein [Segatella copri]
MSLNASCEVVDETQYRFFEQCRNRSTRGRTSSGFTANLLACGSIDRGYTEFYHVARTVCGASEGDIHQNISLSHAG